MNQGGSMEKEHESRSSPHYTSPNLSMPSQSAPTQERIDVNMFDRAVHLALNPPPVNPLTGTSDPQMLQEKQSAEEYLRQFANLPNAWLSALRMLQETRNSNSKFVSLQAVEAFVRSPGYLTQSDDIRAQFRQELFRFTRQSLQSGLICHEPAHVKNKLALILGWTIKRDYPERWPTAIKDILLLGSDTENISGVDLCLRTLQVLHAEITGNADTPRADTESEHNVIVKDNIRQSTDVQQIVNYWYNIIQSYKHTNKDAALLCLNVISSYIDWLDIQFFVRQEYFSLFVECLQDSKLRIEAIECIYAICNKGMADRTKLQLYNDMNIVSLLSSLPLDCSTEENEEFASEVATTIALVTQNSLRAANTSEIASDADMHAIAQKLIQEAIELSLSYLEWDEGGFHVWVEVVPVVDEVMWHTKQHQLLASGEQSKSNLVNFGLDRYTQRICMAIVKRYKYPSNFDFDEKSDDNAEFEEFRKSVGKAFTNGIRARPEAFTSVIQGILGERIPSLPYLPFEEAELLLTLVHHLGEKGSSLASELAPGKTLYEVVLQLHKAQPWNHPHRIVTLSYYEVSVRYSSFFCDYPNLLEPLLSAMLGEKGLWHSHFAVRSRSAYLLLKLVKTLCKNCGKNAIGPLAQPILNGIQPLLAVSFENHGQTQQLSAQDQQFIFELAGVIIGQQWVPTQQKAQYLDMILSPLLEQILHGLQVAQSRGLLQQSANDWNSTRFEMSTEDPLMDLVAWLQRGLNAVAHVTKGFGRLSQYEQLASIFERCMHVALQALNSVPQSTAIRSKVIFLMHRMVACLDKRLLNSLPQALPVLLTVRHCSELCDLVELLNQMLVKFQDEMVPPCSQTVRTLIQRICELLPPESAPQSELASERREIHRHFFLVVQHMLHNGCADSLSTEENIPLLWQILDSTQHGLLNITDMSVIKCCLQIFTAGVDVWLPNRSTTASAGPAKRKLLEDDSDQSTRPSAKSGRRRTPASAFPANPLPEAVQPKFERFVVESLVPASFNFALRGHFNLRDAGCHAAIKEAVLLHAICAERSAPTPETDGRGIDGNMFLRYLRENVLPSLRCDAENANRYCEDLRCALGDPYKQGKKPLYDLLKYLRSQEGLND